MFIHVTRPILSFIRGHETFILLVYEVYEACSTFSIRDEQNRFPGVIVYYTLCGVKRWSVNIRFFSDFEGEYCDTEVFRAECSDGEVIIVDRAMYGRMRLGRCVEMDLGHIGCSRDVLPIIDRRCSGKRVCEIRIPDAEFESTRPCLKELKTFLEANYRCVTGKTGN